VTDHWEIGELQVEQHKLTNGMWVEWWLFPVDNSGIEKKGMQLERWESEQSRHSVRAFAFAFAQMLVRVWVAELHFVTDR
jgi:hypothetical protein